MRHRGELVSTVTFIGAVAVVFIGDTGVLLSSDGLTPRGWASIGACLAVAAVVWIFISKRFGGEQSSRSFSDEEIEFLKSKGISIEADVAALLMQNSRKRMKHIKNIIEEFDYIEDRVDKKHISLFRKLKYKILDGMLVFASRMRVLFFHRDGST